MIYKDDPCLQEHPDLIPNMARARDLSFWFALNRHDSDRLVNLPEWRLITETETLWPTESELI
jgi:hypothetical protein